MTHTRTRSYWIWQVTALAIMVALVTLGILIGRASASPTATGHKWAMSPPDQTEPAYRFRAAGLEVTSTPRTMDGVPALRCGVSP